MYASHDLSLGGAAFASYNGPYGDAPPERGTFFRLERVYKTEKGCSVLFKVYGRGTFLLQSGF